jgi:PleD family two-component response regulator
VPVASDPGCIFATDLFDDTRLETYVCETPQALKSGGHDNPFDRQNRLEIAHMDDELETLPVAESCETRAPKKILIVEDDPDQVEALAFRLRQQGYSVFNALNGADGIQRAHDERPDLVLLDLSLPDQEGLDVCAKLADDPVT